MTKHYDICGIGNALVDQQYNVSFELLKELKLTHGQMSLATKEEQERLINFLDHKQIPSISSCGGSATNTLVASASFGSKCIQLCRVASDLNGQTYFNNLTEFTVDSYQPKTASQSSLPTGSCVVLVTPDSQRTMSTYLGISAQMTTDFISETLINQSKLLYLEGYMVTNPENLNTITKASTYAFSQGIKRALSLSDPGIVAYFKEAFISLCQEKMDIIFCNEAEALSFTQTPSLAEAESALLSYTHTYVITRGEHGAITYDGQTRSVISGKSVTAIDTNGAGDIFAGAFLSAFLTQNTYEKAGIFGNEAAGMLVTQFGPRLSHEQYHSLLPLMNS